MSWMMFVSVLFWVLVIALAFVVVLRLTRTESPRRDARTILAERLARGEIDVEEYRTRVAQIGA